MGMFAALPYVVFCSFCNLGLGVFDRLVVKKKYPQKHLF